MGAPFVGQMASFNGTMTVVNGYTSSVTLSCTAVTAAPPSTCTPSPESFTPANKTPFTLAVGGAAGDYTFNLKATGADTSHSALNPTWSPFINLTHVYGCIPVAAPSHAHQDQHALAAMNPSSGSDSGNALLYFANDGGIHRALDGFRGLVSGAFSGINQFDELNHCPSPLLSGITPSPARRQCRALPGGRRRPIYC
jgi:hypothetical protein